MDYTRDEYYLYFTGNRSSKLSLDFPTPIYLSESSGGRKSQWEIAPLEISLTVNWETFNPDEDYFHFEIEDEGYSQDVAVPAKHINSYRQLSAALNEEKNRYEPMRTNLNFSASNTQITLKAGRADWSVSLSPSLAKKFNDEMPPDTTVPITYRIEEDEESLNLSWETDFYEDRRMIFILCDQAPYQMINKAAHPILGCFPIGATYAHHEWLQHIFYQEHYQTLDCGNVLNGLNISLTDEKMKPLKGVFDHAYCLVHLRRKNLYK